MSQRRFPRETPHFFVFSQKTGIIKPPKFGRSLRKLTYWFVIMENHICFEIIIRNIETIQMSVPVGGFDFILSARQRADGYPLRNGESAAA